jgi:hypothetical protein
MLQTYSNPTEYTIIAPESWHFSEVKNYVSNHLRLSVQQMEDGEGKNHHEEYRTRLALAHLPLQPHVPPA